MTYARARLWLGISGVGFWTTLSGVMLYFAIPARLFAVQPQPLLNDSKDLLLLLLGYIVLSAPFDFLGGYWLPHRFRRPAPSWGKFLWVWTRGVVGQAIVLLSAALILLAAGRVGGRTWAVIAVVLLMLGLLWTQGWLAQWIGGLRTVAADLKPYRRVLEAWGVRLPNTRIVEVTDPAFVGGFTGWPGREQLVLPATWLQSPPQILRFKALPVETVALQITRRLGVLERGSRGRGVLLALLWNVCGFYLATWLPGAGVTTVASLVATACGFTLWSFVGLLILPSFSRPGVLEGDYYALQRGVPRAVLEQTATTLDAWQDDEPARAPWIERIFHPIPSVRSRLASLAYASDAPRGAWQAARVALFLSWGCLGFLSRAVHCNSGRPELWVLFPGD